MDATIDLEKADQWAANLGLVAVPLDATARGARFVMLNGSRGNFCLDLGDHEPEKTFERNAAWSSDVGHYIRVTRQAVTVQRWDRSALDARPYQTEVVARNLNAFQQILERDDPDRGKSIVRFVANCYGTLRSAIPKEEYLGESLDAFLLLLACTIDRGSRDEISLQSWDLPEGAVAAARKIDYPTWDSLERQLRDGSSESLKPLLTYMLRHAAGQVFQEAHSIAVSPRQATLPGLLPGAATLKHRSPSSQGVYFTPPHLARTLVEQTIDRIDNRHEQITVFDPACGSGEILREVIRRLELLGFQGRVHLIGWDSSQVAINTARFALGWERRNSQLRHLSITIQRRDSLDERWPPNLDYITMNPPFLSYEDLFEKHKRQLRDLLGTLCRKRPDLASAFLFLAERHTADGGTIGSIVPSSLLDNESAAKLRGHLATALHPRFIAKFGDLKLFHDAIVDAGMYVGRKDGADQVGKMLWAAPSRSSVSAAFRTLRRFDGAPVSRRTYSVYPIEDRLSEASWAPRPYESVELLKRYSNHSTVQSLFDVHQGIRTGQNSAFVLDDDDLKSLPKRERLYFRDTVINKSIVEGRIVELVHLFYPYGRRAIETEDELRERVPTYYERFLVRHRSALLKRAGVDPEHWWYLIRRRRDRECKKIITTAYGRRGSFAFDDVGDRLVIQGYTWYSVGDLTSEIALAYIAILNSETFDRLLGATSRQVSGGQWDLQNRFVDPLPVPNLLDRRFPETVLGKLADIGSDIHRGKTPERQAWQTAVEEAYDLLWLETPLEV